jgi:hypothetical protein
MYIYIYVYTYIYTYVYTYLDYTCTFHILGNLICTEDGRTILKWIFRKWERVVGPGWSWFRIGTGGGHL